MAKTLKNGVYTVLAVCSQQTGGSGASADYQNSATLKGLDITANVCVCNVFFTNPSKIA